MEGHRRRFWSAPSARRRSARARLATETGNTLGQPDRPRQNSQTSERWGPLFYSSPHFVTATRSRDPQVKGSAFFPSTLRKRGVFRIRLRPSPGLWEDTRLTQGARNCCRICAGIVYRRSYGRGTGSISVRVKSSPLNRSGSPDTFDKAYEKQSPKLRAARCRPFPNMRAA